MFKIMSLLRIFLLYYDYSYLKYEKNLNKRTPLPTLAY